LRAAASDPARLSEAIAQFQAAVWKSNDWEVGLSRADVEVLRDLAYDLDYYEPDIAARAQSWSFFGEERAIEEITQALAQLRATKRVP
jgi:hypothetical protein